MQKKQNFCILNDLGNYLVTISGLKLRYKLISARSADITNGIKL